MCVLGDNSHEGPQGDLAKLALYDCFTGNVRAHDADFARRGFLNAKALSGIGLSQASG